MSSTKRKSLPVIGLFRLLDRIGHTSGAVSPNDKAVANIMAEHLKPLTEKHSQRSHVNRK